MYHVIARGVERKDIFRQAKDYEAFLHRLGDILAQTKVECRAFCLMPNHFHLLLKQTDTPLSSAMRRLLTGYALYFNRARKRSGHLFQNRYKSIICQEDRYLLELIRYIHLNPVRARLTKTFEALTGYPYSGHACLTGKHAYDWYPPERVLELFGRTKARATNAYRQFMLEGLSLGKNPVYSGGGLKRSLGYPKQYPAEPQAYDERILGESDFVLALKTTEENTR
ncbi:MAG: transposase, partial [Chloroflexi bacterium]|nr:transposase [Chloroflexota bacterium]